MTNEELLEKVRELTQEKKSSKCPSCGRCNECGRVPWGTIPMPAPYYPQPTYPYWWSSPYTITVGSGYGTITGNTISLTNLPAGTSVSAT